MNNRNGSSPTVANSISAQNKAEHGAGLYNRTGNESRPTIINSVFWDNVSPNQGSSINDSRNSRGTITFPAITGGYQADTEVANDILNRAIYSFVETPSAARDTIWGSDDDVLPELRDGSPCINSGSSTALPVDTTDLDGDGSLTEQLPLDLLYEPTHFWRIRRSRRLRSTTPAQTLTFTTVAATLAYPSAHQPNSPHRQG
jgi:hypothetical protein